MKNDVRQRQGAKKFVEYWTFQRGSEKGEDQQFWNSLLRDVLGIADVERHIQYQVPVPAPARSASAPYRGDDGRAGAPRTPSTTKYLDAWIPETRVLIEHKSRGVNLEAPQAGHGGLTPYEQAVEYDNARLFDEKARWIVTCNFDEFRVYDRVKPLAPPLSLKLGNLPKEAYRLAFLVNPKEKAVDRELEISVQAGRIVGEIYDALLGQYGTGTFDGRQPTTATTTDNRQVEESDVVADVGRRMSNVQRKALLALQDEIASLTFLDPACGSGNFLTETYICLRRLENRIIAALQQGQAELDLGLTIKVSLAQFFGIEINDFAVAVAKTALWIAESQMKQETAEILHREPDYLPLKDYANIIEGNALRTDWSRIGLPVSDLTIISIPKHIQFQDAKAHLTELKNAKKEVVNAAGERFRFTKQIFKALSDKARDQSVGREVHWAAVAAVDCLCEASVFLWDEKPRNGSVDISRYAKHGVCFSVGDVPYIAKITSKVYPGDITNVTYSVEAVSIERNDARGITDSITKGQGLNPSAANRVLHFMGAVKRATAKKHFSYIIGNPPFRGHQQRSDEQAAEMDAVYADWEDTSYGKLDYVCAWYKKAVDFILAAKNAEGTKVDEALRSLRSLRQTKVAFVSTNSICQGESVAAMWKPMFERAGVVIDFAHRTFRWDNEAFDKAHVHCVIVGFHCRGVTGGARATGGTGGEETAGTIETGVPVVPTVPSPLPPVSPVPPVPPVQKITATAQGILDARARYPNASLADLYDPLTMPPDLRAAHEANDRAVLAAYGLKPDTPEPEIVARLFRLYAEKTAKKD